jgi:hypothetical protein
VVATSGTTTQQLVELGSANPRQEFDVAHVGVVGTERKTHAAELSIDAASRHVVRGSFFDFFFDDLEIFE